MTAPRFVSVVIAAFNVQDYILATLQSVLDQTHQEFEVIVVDDGSTDKTRELVDALAQADSRIRCVRLGKNSGLPAVPRNRGIAEARGELVAFLDHDDLWMKRKLEDQVAAMTTHPDLGLVYSMVRILGKSVLYPGRFYVIPRPGNAVLSATDLECRNTIPTSSVMARLDWVRNLGGFDEDPQLKAVEDYDLWLKISRQGPIGFIPRIHGCYRVHSANTSSIDQEVRRVRVLFEKRGIPSASVLASLASRNVCSHRPIREFVHLATLVEVSIMEALERRVGVAVPVRRTLSCGRSLEFLHLP